MEWFEGLPRDVRERLLDTVEAAVALAPSLHPDDDRHGAYLTVTDAHGRVLLAARVGQISPDCDQHGNALVHVYATLSLEKARRLANRLPVGQRVSFESRDVARHRYGGAVLAGDVIVSLSGLSEADDEAVVLIACVEAGLLTEAQAQARAGVNPNATFAAFYRAFQTRPVALQAAHDEPAAADYATESNREASAQSDGSEQPPTT